MGVVMKTGIVILIGVIAATLSACSQQTQDNAQNTAQSAQGDMVANTQAVMDEAEEAAQSVQSATGDAVDSVVEQAGFSAPDSAEEKAGVDQQY